MPVRHLPAMATQPQSEVKNEPSELPEKPHPALPGDQRAFSQISKPVPAHQGISSNKSLVKPSEPSPKVDEVVKESIDIASIRGLFGWATVDGVSVPYLLRDEKKYVAVRIVEQKLLARFPNTFPEELGKHEPLVSYYVTQNEMNLLDEINSVHCDYDYGSHKFTGKDLIVKLTEFEDFYNLVKKTFPQEVLHARKAGVPLPAPEVLASSKSGWIQVNNTVTPYFRRGLQKFVVLQIIRHAAKLLEDVEVEIICPNEEEYNLINDMCSSAGLAFKFSKSTKLVSLEDVKRHHEVTLMELPLKCPMKYAQYNTTMNEEVQSQPPQANEPTSAACPPSLLRNISMPTQMPVQGPSLPSQNDIYGAQGAPPRQVMHPPAAQQRPSGQVHAQRLPVGQYPMHPAFPGMARPNVRNPLQPQIPGSQEFRSVQQSLRMGTPQNVNNFPRQSTGSVGQNLPISPANSATRSGTPSRTQVLTQNSQSPQPLGSHMFRPGVVPHLPQGERMPGVTPYNNQIPGNSTQNVHMPVISQLGMQMAGLPQQALRQHLPMMQGIQPSRLAVTSQNFVSPMVTGLMRPQSQQQMPIVSSPFAQNQAYVQQPLQHQSSLIRPQHPIQQQSSLIRPQQPQHQRYSMIRPKHPTQQQHSLLIGSQQSTQQPSMIRQPQSPQQQSSMIRSQHSTQQSSMIRQPQSAQQQSSMIRSQQTTQQQSSMIPPPQSAQQQSSMIRSQQTTQQQSSVIRQPQSAQQQSSMIRSQQTTQQSSMIRQPQSAQQHASMIWSQQATQQSMIRQQQLAQQQSSMIRSQQTTQQQSSILWQQQSAQQQSSMIRTQLTTQQQSSVKLPQHQSQQQSPMIRMQQPSQLQFSMIRPPQQKTPSAQPYSIEAQRMANNQNLSSNNATNDAIPTVNPTTLNNESITNMNNMLQRPPFSAHLSVQQKQMRPQMNLKVTNVQKTVYPKIAPKQPIPTALPSELITSAGNNGSNEDGDKANQEVSNEVQTVEQSSESTLSQQISLPGTEGAPEALEVVKLSKCVSGVRFEGRSISCLEYDNLKGKHALVEAVCKLYFPRWKLNEFLYVLEQVLKIPTKACQPNEEKAFIHYYHLPVPVLKCNKMVKLDDLSEHYTKLSYMFGKINGASKSATDGLESNSGETSVDSPVIVGETLATKDSSVFVDKGIIPSGSPVSDSPTEIVGGIKRKHPSGPTPPSKQLKRLEDTVERLKQRPDPCSGIAKKDPAPSSNVNEEVSVIVIE